MELAWIALGFAAGVVADAIADNIAWRSPKLNHHPGLYLRVGGKWYRVIRWWG
jgi:hypothetical protein